MGIVLFGLRARSIVFATCCAACLIVGSGCVVTPWRTNGQAPAPLPQVPEGARSPDVAAGIEQSGKKTDFHAMPTDRQSFQVHIDFGRVFESQGNYDAALQEYQEALTVVATRLRGSLGPADSALAQRRMAGAFDRLGRFAQAEVHYEKALKLAPREPKVWNDVGYSYYLQGRWADAERALKTAATLAPDDDRIRTNLGLTLAAAGKTNEAFPLLSQSTGDATGHANLGYLLAATGQFELARRQYETALRCGPTCKSRSERSPGLTGNSTARAWTPPRTQCWPRRPAQPRIRSIAKSNRPQRREAKFRPRATGASRRAREFPLRYPIVLEHGRARQVSRICRSYRRQLEPDDLAPILDRLGVDRLNWVQTVRDFGRMFKQAAGRASSLVQAAPRLFATLVSGQSGGAGGIL